MFLSHKRIYYLIGVRVRFNCMSLEGVLGVRIFVKEELGRICSFVSKNLCLTFCYINGYGVGELADL